MMYESVKKNLRMLLKNIFVRIIIVFLLIHLLSINFKIGCLGIFCYFLILLFVIQTK